MRIFKFLKVLEFWFEYAKNSLQQLLDLHAQK